MGAPYTYDISRLRVKLYIINPLNAELNPPCHLLALLGAHHILHVSRIRVKKKSTFIMTGIRTAYFPDKLRSITTHFTCSITKYGIPDVSRDNNNTFNSNTRRLITGCNRLCRKVSLFGLILSSKCPTVFLQCHRHRHLRCL